ncbi:MAG TPA: imidazole glycerol phosphate synthase subunit HisH [Vicinamibacteria bacterium]|nr:imidazole glycerol phosphate synthase subunit HisH [Vicinamibacteria bacterium]
MIAIVDYGLGNLGSVAKAFRQVGAPTVLTADRDALRSASALVLPGDGAFGAAMDELRQRSLVPVLLEAEAAGTPILGICVGMQLFFDASEEHGSHAGLGLLRGRVRRFGPGLPVPHMGWNQLRWRCPHAVRAEVADGAHVYFVHSYYAEAAPEDTVATSDYGVEFPAIVARRSVIGMQFHPEKSQAVGLKLVEAFVAIVNERRAGRLSARVVR